MNNFTTTITLALTLLMASAMPASAAEPDFSAATAYMDAGYKSLGMPGAALLVVQDNEVLLEKYFGSYNSETVIPIASASKWLSSALLMSLVDEGKIDLDARISQYFPQFHGKMAEMTIRQMFSHSSGLVGFEREPILWDYRMSMANYADRVAREGVMAADPGKEVRYASTSMQVVGAVAEKVTGKSWNQLFKEKIAEPCNMPNTTYIRTPGTGMPGEVESEADNINPMLAGGAKSSLREYGRFLEMIKNQGTCDGRRVLSEAAVREMLKDQTGKLPLMRATRDRMDRQTHYGLGLWIDEQTPEGKTIQVSSPGAWGFRPWFHLDRNLYAIIMVQREVGAAATNETYNPFTLMDLIHGAVDKAD